MVVVFVQVLLKSRSDFNVVVFCNRLYPRENALLSDLQFSPHAHTCAAGSSLSLAATPDGGLTTRLKSKTFVGGVQSTISTTETTGTSLSHGAMTFCA